MIDDFVDTLKGRQCELIFHLVSGAKSDLHSRPLRVALLCQSLKTELRLIVSPLVGTKAAHKCQFSGKPTRARTCYTPMVYYLFFIRLLTASTVLLYAAL